MRFSWTKRFFELLIGGQEFRALIDKEEWGKAQAELDKRGFPHHLREFSPFFEQGVTPSPEQEASTGYPLVSEWLDFRDANDKARAVFVDFESDNPALTMWRQRQLSRLSGEVGFNVKEHYSPLFAFELNSGCSVQCPFCAFDALRLTKVGRHDELAFLWQGMLRVNHELFGDSAEKGCLYHATEPADSPDYFKFIEDYIAEYGVLPQTTTAAPLRSLVWTHRLIELRKNTPTNSDRFSLLSEDDLHRVHQTFTPDDLVHVKLLLQYEKDGDSHFVRAGRNFDIPENEADQVTIACVCGFLVNLPERTVRLVSPCRASSRYPKGYRVHAENSFDGLEEYKQILLDMIRLYMPVSLGVEDLLRFRKGLSLEFAEESSSIVSRFKRYDLGIGNKSKQSVLEMIKVGGTYKDICDHAEKTGMSFLAFAALVDQLFKAGFLEDLS